MVAAPAAKRTLKPAPLLIPSPVVLVTCRDAAGNDNIITLAWAGVVNSAPPVLGVSIRPSRHSHGIIVASGEFGLNVPGADLLERTDRCGTVSGRHEDKFRLTGLTRLPGVATKVSLIEECPVNLECKVIQRIHLGTHDLFLGEVVALRVSESCLAGDRIDVAKIAPIAYAPEANGYWSLGSEIGRYGFTAKK